MNNSNHPVNMLSVKRIMEKAYYVNELLFSLKNFPLLKVQINLYLNFSFENNFVELSVRVYYATPDSAPIPTPSEIFADITVQNVFEIENLQAYRINENDIKLPQDLLITIVGLSISHTRALFAKQLSSTNLNGNVMAIVNPTELAKHFFPRMFQDEIVAEEVTN